ncbi:hypothetical protein [Cloacibacillus evryensis]|uniref:CarD-like/TRCF RNAP-interacting domain-containing protein n=1 Tax=Cloacibacillus evryensis TaxID=508460 RepID=A0AAW5K581_9BACT|nr:hypothetical protein [Cloacibacillus evryensis]MCQ4813893.1 hypothetical protein [Cloacibacillus evryensis]MEA5035656.1 hypothetical protein [Cloacibacillus evryensis]
MTKEEALELIERIPYVTTFSAPSGKARIDLYKRAVGKKEPLQWLKVVKSCWLRREEDSGKITGTLESEYGKRAKRLLHAELAAALEIKEEEVESFIEGYLKDNV